MQKLFINWRGKYYKDFSFLFLALPAIFLYTIMVVYPVFGSFIYSLTDWDGISKTWHFLWFDNFIRAFQDPLLIASIKNTIIFAILVTILLNVFGMLLAVLLDKNTSFIRGMRILIFTPMVLCSLVVSYLWSYILHPDLGVLNIFLRSVGLDVFALDWLGNVNLALISVVMVAVWQGVGYQFIIYLANLQGIPKELYEAAEIDGAGYWEKFKHITFPMLAPAFTINMILAVIGGLKVFDIVFIMTGGGPGYATEVLSTAMYRKAFNANDVGYGTAISIIMFVLILFVSLILLKILRTREVEA